MYRPAHFEETRCEQLHPLMQAYPLGLLITQDEAGMPVVDPIPFLLEPARGALGTLVGHVARANPVWQRADPGGGAECPVLVVFQGPNAYVSPSAYPSKAKHGRVVPTWNYAVVEARGALRILAPAAAHATVSRLTEWREAGQDHPWAVTDAPPEYVDSMLAAIVCLEIPLTSLRGKFKLSQNRTAQDQAGVSRSLHESPDASAQAVALWMARVSAPSDPEPR